MNPVCIPDILSFLASMAALTLLFYGWKRALRRDTKLLIAGLLFFMIFHSFSNFLEWSGLTNVLDWSEDFFDSLMPMWWAFVFYSILQDIAVCDLRKSEDDYRDLFNSADELIQSITPDGHIIKVNRKWKDTLGYREEELQNLLIWDLVHPGSMSYCKDAIEKVLAGETVNVFKVILLAKNGTPILVDGNVNCRFNGQQPLFIRCILRDVREREKAMEAFRLNEDRLEALLKLGQMAGVSEKKISDFSLEEGVRLTGSQVGYLHFFDEDQKNLQLYSWSRAAMEKCSAQKTSHYPLDRAGVWADCVRLRKPVIHNDYQNLPEKKGHPDGHFPVIRHMSIPVFDDDKIVAVAGVGNKEKPYDGADVRQLSLFMDNMWKTLKERRADEALRESEEKYRILVENANDAIFVVQDEMIKFQNPKTLQMLGYSPEELTIKPHIDFIHPEDRAMVLEKHRKRLAGEESPTTYSFRVTHKNGHELRVQLNPVLINWEGRPATLNFVRDVTQESKLENLFQKAQKMEALGTLAGGIAHDFNNILMGIQGNVSLMSINSNAGGPHMERIKNVEQYIQNGAALTNQLLGFAKGSKYEVKPTDLNELLNKSSEMFARTKKEISFHQRYQEGIWTTEVDPGQIEQVLLNLFVNAYQAMPGSGKLYLETRNVTLDENRVRPYQLTPGRYVKISVTDTGIGMSKRLQERIFEPFFTTKGKRKGTGLGLASVYGIIKNHGGMIDVYSEIGEGTTFNIYLPSSEKKVVKGTVVAEEALTGTETILLVDDEDMIVEIGKEIIESLGYKVLMSRGGSEAIEVFKKNLYKIDLVVLDMIMPDMGGGETYDVLRTIDPEIKVLLSSGYSIEGQANEIMSRGCNGFIQKPFNLTEVSHKIRAVLDN